MNLSPPSPGVPAGFSAEELRAAVAQCYSDVAARPDGAYPFRVGRAFALALGYPAEVLDQVPATAIEAFTGVSCPPLRARIDPGETVVDLGCGAGLDVLLLARAVGREATVIGVDSSRTMVERAQRGIALAGVTNARVIEARADDTGLPSGFADCVIANGILNLSVDKQAIVQEIARVLKPDGRFFLTEITLTEALPADSVKELDDWFR